MSYAVLVVDDDVTVTMLVSRCLVRAGYRTIVAQSPHEALEIARSHSAPFDLVMTDKNLPGMNGFELVAKLREEQPELPAVLMTADPEQRSAAEADLQGYLSKPFLHVDLIAQAARRAIEVGQSRARNRQLEQKLAQTMAVLERRLSTKAADASAPSEAPGVSG